MNSGIYKIVNLTNNALYIGSSKELHTRKTRHLYELRKNQHHSSYLQNAWNKYGEEAFKHEIILYCPVEDLLVIEQYLIDYYQPVYNMSKVAGNPGTFIVSEETRKKLSVANKGKKYTLEQRLKMRDYRRNQRVIYKIDSITFVILDEYKSVAEAGRINNINRSSIGLAASEKGLTSGKFMWCYKDQYSIEFMKAKKETFQERSRIYQFNSDNILIGTFNSVTEAAQKFNLLETGICVSMKYTKRMCGGYYWSSNINNSNKLTPKSKAKLTKAPRKYRDGSSYDSKLILKISLLDNCVLDSYKCLKDAVESNNLRSGSLYNCLNGYKKTYAGFIWKYKNNDHEHN